MPSHGHTPAHTRAHTQACVLKDTSRQNMPYTKKEVDRPHRHSYSTCDYISRVVTQNNLRTLLKDQWYLYNTTQ